MSDWPSVQQELCTGATESTQAKPSQMCQQWGRGCCPWENGENLGDRELWWGRGYEKGKGRVQSLAPIRFASLTSSVHRARERVGAWLSSLLGAKIEAVKETGKKQADTKEEKAGEERKRTWKHYPQNQGRHASHINFQYKCPSSTVAQWGIWPRLFTLCVFNNSNNDNKKPKPRIKCQRLSLILKEEQKEQLCMEVNVFFSCLQKSFVGGFKKFQWWSW